MKKGKKLTALLLCLALLLALTACGSFEQKMVRAAAKMEKLESYHTDTVMEMGMSMSLLGEAMDMDMTLSAASDVNSDPLRVKTASTLELMGESMEMLSYTFAGEEEGSYDTWLSLDGGESWEKGTLKSWELKGLNLRGASAESLEFLRECAESFTEAGKEEINGSQATRYDGALEGEAMAKAVEASGVLDSLGEGLDLELDLGEALESLSGSIPTSLWIDDKSGMIVRYDMDMTEVFTSVWDNMTAQLMESEELEGFAGFGLTLTLDHLRMSATISDFNDVPEILLPDGIK